MGYHTGRKTRWWALWHHENIAIMLLVLTYPWKANSHKSFLYLCTHSSTSIIPPYFFPEVSSELLPYTAEGQGIWQCASAVFNGLMGKNFINMFHSTVCRLQICFINLVIIQPTSNLEPAEILTQLKEKVDIPRRKIWLPKNHTAYR